MGLRLLAAVLAVAAMGCPGSSSSGRGAPPEHCTKMGERCSLGKGVLGVCSESHCAPGQQPPCIRCTGQH
jgi:hypothetical protein